LWVPRCVPNGPCQFHTPWPDRLGAAQRNIDHIAGLIHSKSTRIPRSSPHSGRSPFSARSVTFPVGGRWCPPATAPVPPTALQGSLSGPHRPAFLKYPQVRHANVRSLHFQAHEAGDGYFRKGFANPFRLWRTEKSSRLSARPVAAAKFDGGLPARVDAIRRAPNCFFSRNARGLAANPAPNSWLPLFELFLIRLYAFPPAPFPLPVC